MTAPLAAKKMPPLAPGEFRFITKGIEMEAPGEDGRRRFKMVASSTVVDEGDDEIKLSALRDLEASFRRGLNIFTDHEHKVDNVFGRTDTAEIKASGEIDQKTGAPIYDLHVAGVVNVPDPRMVRLADSIDGGYVSYGASIGARVRDHKRNKAGGMDIYHLDGKEASLVGIPINQRSWTYKAAKAARRLDDSMGVIWDDDEDDDEVETAKALDTTEGEALQKQGLCDSCGHDASCDCTGCDCGGLMHTEHSKELDSNALTVKAADEGLAEDADVQESEEASEEEPTPETPETPAAEESDKEPETAEAEKAFAFDATDVVELAQHVRTLVAAIGDRDAEIETLKSENGRLSNENEEAKALIEKVLAMPLRPRAVAAAEDLNKKLPEFLAPEVREFLTKSAGENR